jgi:hypothetical protein
MQMLSELEEFFNTHEWFDNSRIKTIRGCKRKAYYKLLGPQGDPLEETVGDGAMFGSAWHAGLASYYAGWHVLSEEQRRVAAARAFSAEWAEGFPHGAKMTKHQLSRGLDILDGYFSHFMFEDELYEPVETEIGFCVEIKPHDYELQFKPFWYIGRADGIFKRVSHGDLYLRETKTTASNVEARLKQLKFDHQPVGYTHCLRNMPGGSNIVGFIGDVVLVAVQKMEFGRDYFTVSRNDGESWRRQLINTVEDWRALQGKVGRGGAVGDIFYQDTERCHDYGKCAFYDLCDYGIGPDTLAQFSSNMWNPLLKRPPRQTMIISEGSEKPITISR